MVKCKGVPGHTLHREIEIKQTNILSHLLVYLQLVRLQTFQQNMKLLFTKRPVYEKSKTIFNETKNPKRRIFVISERTIFGPLPLPINVVQCTWILYVSH